MRDGKPNSRQRRGGRWRCACATPSFTLTSPSWMMHPTEPSIAWQTIAAGARRTCRSGWAMAAFDYRQAQEVRDAFARWGVRYLFIGKSAAILLGFPDTTQDADLFPQRSPENGA